MGSVGNTAAAVTEVALRFGNARPIPAVGMGTAVSAPMNAVLAAIEVGFRHLDTAAMYGSERSVGEAVAEAVRRGLLESREEVFVTSKLNLQMEYLDLYLIHWPVCMKPGPIAFPAKKEDAVPFAFEGVWRAMEECQRLGLAKAIGVSNFTTKHLDKILAFASIPPAVNQVELNPVWQQRKLRAYCADKGIHVVAYSPLGGQDWSRTGEGNGVLGSQVLAEIAQRRGKTIAQVSLRWIYEQGVTWIVKSFNKERLKQNLDNFDWKLTEEDWLKIRQIPQKKYVTAAVLFSTEGEFTSVDLADMDVVEE
ncbi:unnamed protein product [Miscanthus lutarioriparius]|uniref:NADP-dependent oxidoreductase domain-containing protein n=1 Tax=Miscanthus lutarioriparius TaxID=422564 RepID=A0A811QWI9_9POAL|nr:unnamed protein product [Miscanthus lutarioriparius]